MKKSTLDKLTAILEEAGFEIVDFKEERLKKRAREGSAGYTETGYILLRIYPTRKD
jgi:hypothetical protein